MLQKLPAELLSGVLDCLEYDDLNQLLNVPSVEPIVRHHLLRHFKFHYQIGSLLRLFESLTPSERHLADTRNELARQFLHLICHHVEGYPKVEQRTQFTDKLEILHDLVLKRILSSDLRPGLEHDYAAICLDIRSIYLHTPSIRVLHDPVCIHAIVLRVFIRLQLTPPSTLILYCHLRNTVAEARNTPWRPFCQETSPTSGVNSALRSTMNVTDTLPGPR